MDTPLPAPAHILLFNLPPSFEKALQEQLATAIPHARLITGVEQSAQPPCDLVLYAEGRRPAPQGAVTPATPLLEIGAHKRHRLGVLLRQARQMLDEPALYLDPFMIGDFLFDAPQRQLTQQDEKHIALTDRETDILVYLARNHARAVPRDELLQNVWRYQQGLETHTLETHIYRLRQKMEPALDAPKLLLTQGAGYRLIAPLPVPPAS